MTSQWHPDNQGLAPWQPKPARPHFAVKATCKEDVWAWCLQTLYIRRRHYRHIYLGKAVVSSQVSITIHLWSCRVVLIELVNCLRLASWSPRPRIISHIQLSVPNSQKNCHHHLQLSNFTIGRWCHVYLVQLQIPCRCIYSLVYIVFSIFSYNPWIYQI